MRVYLDTCVWIAFIDEKDTHHKKAVKIFEGLDNKLVLITMIHYKELENKGLLEDFKEVKNELYEKGKCFGVKVSLKDKEKALELNKKYKLGKDDFLHMLTAKRHKAKPISFDKHWEEIKWIINP